MLVGLFFCGGGEGRDGISGSKKERKLNKDPIQLRLGLLLFFFSSFFFFLFF